MVPEGWKSIPLENISEASAPIRYGVVQIGEDTADGVPIVPIKFITSISTSKLHRASKKIEEKYANSRVQGGDVLISVKGTIGAIGVVPEGFAGNIAREIARIRPSGDYDPAYIALQLLAEKTQREIDNLTVGTTRREFSIHALRKFSILVPPLPEQKKIAQILSTWDKSITTTEQLLANIQQQKKALMQQLLTGKQRLLDQNGERFEGEWDECLLGDISKITTGSSNRQDSHMNGAYTFFDRSEDIRTSDTYLFDCEAVIVPGEGQDFIPKYFVGKFDLHQRTYAIMNFPECEGKFLFYAIHYFRSHFLSQAVGSTVKSLRLPMFQKMKLKLPTREEQQKIASVLSAADQEITTLQQQLNHLKQEKKALMQQLLTGKRRVKIEEKEVT